MLVGAGGTHEAPPPDAAACLVVPAFDAAVELDFELVSEPLLPQAASTAIDNTAPAMGRHLLQVRTSAPPLSLVTL
jgi:hypothetical protein